jgi:hypothetical protein
MSDPTAPSLPAPFRDTPLTAQWLGYLGLAPFVGQALVVAFGPAGHDGLAAHAAQGIVTYGAAILSFLGGITWGLTVGNPRLAGPRGAREVMYSMLPALGAWVALLLPTTLALWFLVAGFGFAFVHDRRMATLHGLPPWFIRLRLHLSLGAALSVAATALCR